MCNHCKFFLKIVSLSFLLSAAITPTPHLPQISNKWFTKLHLLRERYTLFEQCQEQWLHWFSIYALEKECDIGECWFTKYIFLAFGITCYNCRNVDGINSCGDFDSRTPIQVRYTKRDWWLVHCHFQTCPHSSHCLHYSGLVGGASQVSSGHSCDMDSGLRWINRGEL